MKLQESNTGFIESGYAAGNLNPEVAGSMKSVPATMWKRKT